MLLLKNATVINGIDEKPLPCTDVLIENRTVKEVNGGIRCPEGTTVIDLTGKTIIPGLSDAHVHFGGTERIDRPGLQGRFATYDYAEAREQFLSWGVTAVRSCGDYTPEIFEYREEVEAGKIISPHVVSAGKMFQARNGHPFATVFFSDKALVDTVMVFVDDDTDIDAEVKKVAEQGADFIKAFISEVNKMTDPPSAVPRLTNKQLRAIADAAHKYGKKLSVHVDDIAKLEEAFDIGADYIEHVINVATEPKNHIMSDALLEKLTTRDVFFTPTLIGTRNHDQTGKFYPAAAQAAGRMIKAGLKICVGCDSAIPFVPFGEGVHTEMELLCDCGMSPLQAINAATGMNARLMGRSDEFGSVRPGLRADLVVLGSDPTKDIRGTRDIDMVLRDGKVVVDKLLGKSL